MRFVFCFLSFLALSGCQTKYQELGYSGGVTAQPVTNDIYRIVSRGNGYTNPTTIQDYALLKAAEVTLNSGNSHFAVMNERQASTSEYHQTPGTFQSNVIGSSVYTTYNPGTSYNIVKPGQDLMIRVAKFDGAAPSGYFPAQQVYNNISPRVVRPKS